MQRHNRVGVVEQILAPPAASGVMSQARGFGGAAVGYMFRRARRAPPWLRVLGDDHDHVAVAVRTAGKFFGVGDAPTAERCRAVGGAQAAQPAPLIRDACLSVTCSCGTG